MTDVAPGRREPSGEVEVSPGTTMTAPRLSPRQYEVLGLIADGFTEAEIALELGISPRTVRMHSDVLRVKLGVARRRELPRAYRRVQGDDLVGRLAISSRQLGSEQ